MTDITYIILGIVLIVGGLITGFGIPFIRSKLNAEQLSALKAAARIAVYAAEQIFGAKMGPDKLQYALNLVKSLLAKKNLSFDDEAVRAAIEAQVKEMNIDIGGAND